MLGVNVAITRYADDSNPGWVECKLIDARGREWAFIEKVPVVTAEDLHAHSKYPQPGVIACEILERTRTADGREVITIDTIRPWGVESTTGESRFDVTPEQMIEFDWNSAS
jgi:hypothetical protein